MKRLEQGNSSKAASRGTASIWSRWFGTAPQSSASDPVADSPPIASDRMGQALLETGKLTEADIVRIVELQQAKQLRFGEAAVELGLLTTADVQHILAQQFNYQGLAGADASGGPAFSLHPHLHISHRPFSADAEAVRRLRSEVLIRMGDASPLMLAVVSPDRQEGKSHLAASLSIALAQSNLNTLLVDANLRSPTQHLLFGLPNQEGVSSLLAGRAAAEVDLTREITPHLKVLTSGPIPPNPTEILSAPRLTRLLDGLKIAHQVLVIDTPGTLIGPDAQIIGSQVGTAVLVGRADKSSMDALRHCIKDMQTAGVRVLGSFYNTVTLPSGHAASPTHATRWLKRNP